uniref:Integrase, catalytic region, zinc finger, CCHC-type, peptidase aspartic, catalytic n=1 Tax=Tanacetum cinerariifolium TaxID=118510 RepID=A0A6L2KHQ4_TANCI|nr:hypothetical protein [Tanacetum cinerariifolium]
MATTHSIVLSRKKNRVNILKSIDEGPFQMGMFQETLAKGEECAFHLGPERPQVYFDLSPKEKGRVDRIEVRGTMHEVQVQLVMGELKTEFGMLIQVKWTRQFVDEDVDEPPVQDLALMWIMCFKLVTVMLLILMLMRPLLQRLCSWKIYDLRILFMMKPVFNMTSLADKAILSGADNRPPMLENDMYDSWKSRMELYMLNRQHGRMILESVEHGPLLWPTVEEDGVTRLKKYSELSAAEAIQADCDVKATNIILQGLPPKVYALVSTHKVAKELWKSIQMLMQGTSLTKQERECKLYDEFDKFAYQKGETLRDFYLRYSLLLNDMNMYNMKLEQFQVNMKLLNTLPPE